MDAKKNKYSQKGQAIYEFILFVPIMLIIYGVCINLFGAINASINQQKSTRGYLYARLKGNSFAPSRGQVGAMQNRGARVLGPVALGWREKDLFETNEIPQASCFKVQTLTQAGSIDTCEQALAGYGPTSFIRVKTVYGICGTSYVQDNLGQFVFNMEASFDRACEIRQ